MAWILAFIRLSSRKTRSASHKTRRLNVQWCKHQPTASPKTIKALTSPFWNVKANKNVSTPQNSR